MDLLTDDELTFPFYCTEWLLKNPQFWWTLNPGPWTKPAIHLLRLIWSRRLATMQFAGVLYQADIFARKWWGQSNQTDIKLPTGLVVCVEIHWSALKIAVNLRQLPIRRTWVSTIYSFGQNRANVSLVRYERSDSEYLSSQHAMSLCEGNCVGNSS